MSTVGRLLLLQHFFKYEIDRQTITFYVYVYSIQRTFSGEMVRSFLSSLCDGVVVLYT